MQDEYWETREGARVRPENMTLQHLRNTVAMLERKAVGIELRHTMRLLIELSTKVATVIGEDEHGQAILADREKWADLMPRGEMAIDAFERELDWRREHPVEWLHTLPLIAKMDRLIAERSAGVRRTPLGDLR
jgi:hypothetical protein